jgi:hypothetical protein
VSATSLSKEVSAADKEAEREALERHRNAVLREVIVTERSYCQDLSILIDVCSTTDSDIALILSDSHKHTHTFFASVSSIWRLWKPWIF